MNLVEHNANGPWAISLEGVTKTFLVESQRVNALRDVNLRVSKGTCVSITGRSGAGKSTLLHLIGTLDRPSSGTVRIAGVDVSKLPDRATSRFRNQKLGFVFQTSNLLPEFSALENVMMPGIIAGARGPLVAGRAQQLLDAVGLAGRVAHRPAELSGGEQQRVAIARALFMEPEVILADEPTGNLDKATSLAVQDLMIDLAQRHQTTMVLVTHDPELAERAPSRVVMEDGRIISAVGVEAV